MEGGGKRAKAVAGAGDLCKVDIFVAERGKEASGKNEARKGLA